MQTGENAQSYLPVISVGNELPKTTNVAITPTGNYQAVLSNSSGNMEDFLIAAGKYYAMKLAMVLSDLKNLNEDAIYPVTFILQPYIMPTELNVLLPQISSSEATAGSDDNEGKEFEPGNVQDEPFFRFLDELESGSYAADDIATEV